MYAPSVGASFAMGRSIPTHASITRFACRSVGKRATVLGERRMNGVNVNGAMWNWPASRTRRACRGRRRDLIARRCTIHRDNPNRLYAMESTHSRRRIARKTHHRAIERVLCEMPSDRPWEVGKSNGCTDRQRRSLPNNSQTKISPIEGLGRVGLTATGKKPKGVARCSG